MSTEALAKQLQNLYDMIEYIIMLKIYLLNTDELKNINWNETMLSERRRSSIERARSKAARELSLCAELALIYAVREYAAGAGIPFVLPLDITEEAGGKPCFAASSPFAGKLHFSLSHSGSFAAAAISDSPVGVDIEYIRKEPVHHPEKILHPDEYKIYSKITDLSARNIYFYKCWVSKESFLKEAGLGIRVRPSEFMISEDIYRASTGFGSAHPGLTDKKVHIFSTEEHLPQDYCVAVCSKYGYEGCLKEIYL